MVAFGFHEAGVKFRERRVDGLQRGGEELKLFAASSLDERATYEMIDDLVPLPIADRPHQAGNPWAGIRLSERDASLAQQGEHKLKMLEFLDGDGVEFADTLVKIAIFFQI